MRRLLVAAVLALAAVPALADAVFITEFKGAPPNSVYYQAATAPPLANQAIVITPNSSEQSAAFNSATGLIRVQCAATSPAVCNVQIGGTNPTATGASMRMLDGQTEYFVVKAGDKLAVFQQGPL
jgi:phospholipase C